MATLQGFLQQAAADIAGSADEGDFHDLCFPDKRGIKSI
jgi:hypothetical protein